MNRNPKSQVFPEKIRPELTFAARIGIIHRRKESLTGKQVRILCSAAAVLEESDTKSHWRVCAGKAYQAVTLKPEDLKMSMRGYAP